MKNGANRNTIREVDGVTPLMSASFNGHESIVKYLVSFGDINVLHRNNVNLTAFTCAVIALNENICQLLYTYIMNEHLYYRFSIKLRVTMVTHHL